MNTENLLGLIYRIDYIGDISEIRGLSYGGSKRYTTYWNWDTYYGSPSTKGCIKCKIWKEQSKFYPEQFVKTIIKYVYNTSITSLVEEEQIYLRSVSDNIVADPKWLNNSIPRIGAFPEYKFTPETMSAREVKRKKTCLDTFGFECGIIDIKKRKATCMKLYGVDHFAKTEQGRQLRRERLLKYFGAMTAEERKAHGQKSLQNRTLEGIRSGIEKMKITKSAWSKEKKQSVEDKRFEKWQKLYYNHTPERQALLKERCRLASRKSKQLSITLRFLSDNRIESKFILEWLDYGFARDGIMYRVKDNSKQPLYSRTRKEWIVIEHAEFLRRYFD